MPMPMPTSLLPTPSVAALVLTRSPCSATSSHPTCPTVPPKSALNKMLTPHATATCYQKPIVRKQPPSNELSVKTVPGPGPLKRLQSNGLTAELESMIHDHQRTKGSSTLVRASSGNVMLYGNLGNIRAPGAVTTNHHLSKAAAAAAETRENANNDNAVSNSSSSTAIEPVMSMCRALSRRLDPEELKEMGNDEYSKGRYPEAIALYDRAISSDPQVASYHSNKAAALMRHGLLLDAVAECTEAVRLDPCYSRAHHRLATLHLRLGEAEKAIRYYKLAKGETKANDISQGQALQSHLNKCNEAHRLKDWHTVLKEAEAAVNSGADAAPQVFAYQAEALLMTHKQEEADSTLIDAPKYDIDASTSFFGPCTNAYVLAVQAQVNIAAGRFEDAVKLAQKAARLDPSSKDANAAAQKALAVANARSKGNDLFKASKFGEACIAYGEGLDHDAHNAILLCNRAACRSKLGQWEKAIEDCNAALNMRPSYTKARLRRADCNSKLERWAASIEDYENLLDHVPGDEEISKALTEAQAKLKKQQEAALSGMINSGDSHLIRITAEDQFRHIIMSSGLSVTLFFSKQSEASNPSLPLMEQLCKQYPSINFLKVDVEENASLKKSESVTSVPSFNVYKKGSIIKGVSGSDHHQLESTVRSFTTN
ncbi:LOW QUALITY PROTEIN: TPR repeat-containing thioredoxin TTL4-like [Dioscorea cayenensis subsp. rotundata]|uniref:LOW QUALITY PROTEIN: TPR repeat-containing thioredoxin TTL4-like n=1 Tax=Dioscorea cayennensis subsp. rotundata TaxID=55577 RepID=A0AB40AUX6_DIOCR|nr:LOW QUALITY PROTEIN: TPR repeat-containing thioredoxin TTL4-like [Dioscorea cayenensis subsp. rotundata]